jgi:ribosomal protein L37AE/L43A
MKQLKRKCLVCGTTKKSDFTGKGVAYCDKCVLKTAKPINYNIHKRTKEAMNVLNDFFSKL